MWYNVKMINRRAARLAIIALALFLACQGIFAAPFDAAALRRGRANLSDKWEFYGSELYQPYNFYPVQLQQEIPHQNVTLPYTFADGVKYATFHCRLTGLVPNQYYATDLYGAVISSFQLWCNGKLMATSGFLSKDKSTAKSGECFEVVDLPTDANGVLDIVIHVADFEVGRGGIVKQLWISEKGRAQRFYNTLYFVNMLAFAFLMCQIVYNAALLFFSARKKNFLPVIILSIFLSASVLFTGISLTQKLLPQLPYLLRLRLPITLFCIEAAILVVFETSMVKASYKKILALFSIAAANALFTLLVPIRFFTLFQPIFAGVALVTTLFSVAIRSAFPARNGQAQKKLAKRNVMIYGAHSMFAFLLFAMCVIDFIVIPQTETQTHPYILFKIAIIIFETIECVIYAFNRAWTIERVTRFSQKLMEENETLSKFFSEKIISLMGASDITKIIPGESRIIESMIFCAQIKHYGTLLESINRAELFEIVSEFYKTISPIILDSGGFVAKNTHGSCIAIFLEKNSDAIACAARAQKKLKDLRQKLRRRHRTDIGVGISIHSGKVALGTMGTNYRLETAVISDDINIARAVAKQTSKMNSQILITEEAMPYCRSYIDFMYEGHFFILEGKQVLVYSALPITKKESAYEETLEAIDDDENLVEL